MLAGILFEKRIRTAVSAQNPFSERTPENGQSARRLSEEKPGRSWYKV
jgi:hypothetical protein